MCYGSVKMKKCLNLGCGLDYKQNNSIENWVNLDNNKNIKADIYFNLNDENWVFSKNSIYDYILCNDCLEHLFNTINSLKEISRILKPSGILNLKVPIHYKYHFKDPTHYRYFNKYTVDYFIKGGPYWFMECALFKLIKTEYHNNKFPFSFFEKYFKIYFPDYSHSVRWILQNDK